MFKHQLPYLPSGTLAIIACVAGLILPTVANAAATVEPRIMAQAGLDIGLTLSLLQQETDVINNFNVSPPACSKLPSDGSIETVSTTKVSNTQYTATIDTYFDTACKVPYIEANVSITISNSTETLTITDTANYMQQSGKALGTLDIKYIYSETKSTATLRGLGKFTQAGAKRVADVGFTCSIPTADNAKTATCQGGVAQIFTSLKLSLASVTPFTLTAAKNTNAPAVTLAGSTSNLRTGRAGSLTITAPTPETLGIGGGGTAFTSTTLSGTEAHYTLFPPEPTNWTVTDTANGVAFAYKLVSNTTRAGRATVATISPAATLATVTLDRSGSGKASYSDTKAALVRFFLQAD